MSETNDLFKEDKQPNTQETPEQPQTDPFADKLLAIRNENGEPKYKDVNQALEALQHSQAFIEQLKNEKRELENKFENTESELKRMKAIEEYVERLKPSDPPASQPKETPSGNGGLSEEQIAQLLEERLAARDREAKAATNLETVVNSLTQNFGDKASEVIKQRAQELNTTPEQIKKLAMDNPVMALTLLGSQGSANPSPTKSTHIPPREVPNDNPRPQWERSVVHGGLTNRELTDRWKEAQQYTHKRLGVKS